MEKAAPVRNKQTLGPPSPVFLLPHVRSCPLINYLFSPNTSGMSF